MITPRPTTRFVVDLGRKCNLEGCKFCYYRQLGDLRKQSWKLYEELIKIIDDGYRRGNDCYDFTGAEPSIYPRITELIEYALNRYNLKGCIITNGIASERTFQNIIDSGIDSFLMSIHGTEKIHDYLIGLNGGFLKHEKTLELIKRNNKYLRFNCVINKFNQHQLLEISEYMAKWKPGIVNFINMNLHHQWKDDTHTAKEVVADLRKVEPLLNQAIKYLEERNIGVNVRYYPMCRIAEEYRRCICNDLHVMFDDKEWDYCTLPKTVERYYQWGVATSNNNEEKGEPCTICKLQHICGGGNKHFHRVANDVYGEVFDPITNITIRHNDFYYYRQFNERTLQPR